MEVIKESASMLSNYEVFTLLSDINTGQNGQRKPSHSQQNLATISYSAMKHLQTTPCSQQSPEMIANFMRAVEQYNLTKAEKLQLLNSRPTSAVEIQLMIEESEERLSENQIEELIEIVSSCLPDEGTTEEDMETS